MSVYICLKNFIKSLLVCAILTHSYIFAIEEVSAESHSKWQSGLIKNGYYRSLGFYSGYYHYGEVDTMGDRVMRMDTLMFGLIGQMGLVSQSGVKLEGTLRLNYALGVYTGSILDVDNEARNGERLKSIIGAVAGDLELKAGYNMLKHFSTHHTLYLQGGLGYHLNRTEFIAFKRYQGYFYVPLELEGESAIYNNLILTYGGGYRYLIFGNHFTDISTSYNGNLRVTQKDGFGANAFIGVNFYTKAGEVRNVRLVYEYWSIEASKPSAMQSVYTGEIYYFYEPKNSTHRVFLQYSFGF